MADVIELEMRIAGIEEVLRDLQRVNRGLGQHGREANRAGDQVDQFAAVQRELRREVRGALTEFGSIATAMGQVGATVGRLGPRFSQLGAAIGAAGQAGQQIANAFASPSPTSVVSAAIAVGAAVVDAVRAFESFRGEVRDTGQEARSVAADINTLVGAMQRARRERAQESRIRAGLGTDEEQEAFVTRAEKQRRRVRADLEILEDRRDRLIREQGGLSVEQRRRIDEETEALGRRGRELDDEIDRRRQLARVSRAEATEITREDLAESAREEPGRRGGGRSRGGREALFVGDDAEAGGVVARFREALARAREEDAAFQEAMQRSLQEEIATVQELERAQAQAHEAEMRRRDELKAKRREEHEAQLEMLERAKEKEREAFEQTKSDAEGVLGPAISGLTQALAEVIAGTKTAEEAFQGLLASFLEMLAQQAALEAAKEFASAIAAFARYDYSGGGQHLAAGIAWTGVAIAAGAGAIAAAPTQPQGPQAGESTPQQGGGAGTTVYNVNGTIISTDGASSRARAGREIGSLVSEGTRRYGRTR